MTSNINQNQYDWQKAKKEARSIIIEVAKNRETISYSRLGIVL